MGVNLALKLVTVATIFLTIKFNHIHKHILYIQFKIFVRFTSKNISKTSLTISLYLMNLHSKDHFFTSRISLLLI